ncbi:MAG: plasmid pRiA4b ORF-3 family protein [Bacteroidales bacterium]|nr:plasmid pRiA4b ORF-3 family protein [Bacteroidales bacterium]
MALDANKYPISFLLREKKDRIKYEYDFGDGWEHEVWLKGIREYEPSEQPCLKVVKGVGECPPEDCGGVWGYAELLEILKKKRKSKDDKERLEWYCMDLDYDPDEFDIEYHQDLLDDIWEEAIMTTKY